MLNAGINYGQKTPDAVKRNMPDPDAPLLSNRLLSGLPAVAAAKKKLEELEAKEAKAAKAPKAPKAAKTPKAPKA